MNEKFFIHEITLFHLDDNTATKQQYPKVYFRHDIGMKSISKGEIIDSSGMIVIPTAEKIDVEEGDYVIEGLIDDNWDYRTLCKKHKIFQIVKVHDNRKGNLQHYKLEVKD